MTNAAVLLDKAKKNVSPPNYSGLAARLEVSRQSVHRWKIGDEPIPEDRIAQLARLAQVDVGEWIVVLHAERSKGEIRKGIVSVLKRAGIGGIALALCVVAGADFAAPAAAHAAGLVGLPIMSSAALALISLAWWCARTRRLA